MAEITRKEYIPEGPTSKREPLGRLFKLLCDGGVQRTFGVRHLSEEEYIRYRRKRVVDTYLVCSNGAVAFEYESKPGSCHLQVAIYSQGNHAFVHGVAEDILGIKLKEIPTQ